MRDEDVLLATEVGHLRYETCYEWPFRYAENAVVLGSEKGFLGIEDGCGAEGETKRGGQVGIPFGELGAKFKGYHWSVAGVASYGS